MTNIQKRSVEGEFYARVFDAAKRLLLTEDPAEVANAAARIAQAFVDQMSSARDQDKQYWIACTGASIASAVQSSIKTNLYPGGVHAKVYVFPEGGRLQWRITHRGVIELCRRAGMKVSTFALGPNDRIEEANGRVVAFNMDLFNPPATIRDLRGVIVEWVDGRGEVERRLIAGSELAKRCEASKMKGGPWSKWPIEMAIKSAILYYAARGDLRGSEEIDAVIQVEAKEARREAAQLSRPGRSRLLGGPPVVEEQAEEPEVEYVEPHQDQSD